jgi:hypothetical protein
MRDFGEYLRAYRAYVSANLGWGKALRFALVWLAGMFAPLAAKTSVKSVKSVIFYLHYARAGLLIGEH